jgi:hypothetical protein
MARRFYETKEITLPFHQRKKPTNVKIGLLVYQGEQNAEQDYAPSCLKKVMRILCSPEWSKLVNVVPTLRTDLVKKLAAPFGK